MIQEVKRYTTADGSVFDSLQAAEDHQNYLTIKPTVDAFLDKYYPIKPEGKNGPSRSIAQAAIVRWLSENKSA